MIKKKNKKKKNLVILFSIMLVLMMCFVSASAEIWDTFGNDNQGTQTYDFIKGFVNDITGYIPLETTIGIEQGNAPTQPIMIYPTNDDDLPRVVLLENGVLYLTGLTLDDNDDTTENTIELNITYDNEGQLSGSDFNQDGITGEIAGIFKKNNTQYYFKVYNYNSLLNQLQEIYSYEINFTSISVSTGVRCQGSSCFSVFSTNNSINISWFVYSFNNNQITNFTLKNNNEWKIPLEVPSRVDYNSDGTTDNLIFSENKVLVYRDNGTIINEWEFSRGADRDEYINGAKFIYNGTGYIIGVTYDVPYQAWSSVECGSGYSCGKMQLLNIDDGSIIAEENVINSVTTSDNARIQGSAVADYNNDGIQDFYVLGQRLTANKIGSLKVYDEVGTELYSNITMPVSVNGAQYPNSHILLAPFNEDTALELFSYPQGYVHNFNLEKTYVNNILNGQGITGQGSCIVTAFHSTAKFDIICVDDNSGVIFASGMFTGFNYQIPTTRQTVINLVGNVSSIFPDSDDLTDREKTTYVVVIMFIVAMIMLITFALIEKEDMGSHFGVFLWLLLVIEFLFFIYFVTIGYISIGVVVILVLIGMIISYFKFFHHGK